MNEEQLDDGAYADYLYDCEKDRISEEQIEEMEKLKNFYLKHIFFKNDANRLYSWLSDALRIAFQEEIK